MRWPVCSVFAGFVLAACATPEPAVEIRTVEVVREIQRPCIAPGELPERPGAMPRPLPRDSRQLSAVLAQALLRWAGPGGYGDRAEALLEACAEDGATPQD